MHLDSTVGCTVLQLQDEDKPPHVVAVLLDKLNVGTEDETEWLEHSVAEIVMGVPAFLHSPQAMSVLQDSLALEFLSKPFVQKQLLVSLDYCCQAECCMYAIVSPYMVHGLLVV